MAFVNQPSAFKSLWLNWDLNKWNCKKKKKTPTFYKPVGAFKILTQDGWHNYTMAATGGGASSKMADKMAALEEIQLQGESGVF